MNLNSNSHSSGRLPRARRPRPATVAAGPVKTSGRIDRGLWWIMCLALVAALATGIQSLTTADLDDSQASVESQYPAHHRVPARLAAPAAQHDSAATS